MTTWIQVSSSELDRAKEAAGDARKKVEETIKDLNHLVRQLDSPEWKHSMPGGAHFVNPRLEHMTSELRKALVDIHEAQTIG